MQQFAVVVAGPDGIIHVWPEEAQRLFGHCPDAVVGRALDVIVPEPYRDRHWTGFRALMAGEAQESGDLDRGAVRLPVRCDDGSLRHCGVRLILLRDPWGRPVGAAAVFAADESAPDDAEPLPDL